MTTRNLDVLALIEHGRYVKAAPLPPGLVEPARYVARLYGLVDDWLNPGPTSVLDFGLPAGFAQRAEILTFSGLTRHLARRLDQMPEVFPPWVALWLFLHDLLALASWPAASIRAAG